MSSLAPTDNELANGLASTSQNGHSIDENVPIWTPKHRAHLPIFKFKEFVENAAGKKFENYAALHDWSTSHTAEFWALVWKFGRVVHSMPYTEVIDNARQMYPPPRWFANAKLNYAENLLRAEWPDSKVALVFQRETLPGETTLTTRWTYGMLRAIVRRYRQAMRSTGVTVGDRVAGYMPNCVHTIVAMLAASSLGAVWSCASPDFGPNAVLQRLQQVEPKILFSVEAVVYNGKVHPHLDKLREVVEGLPSVEKVVLIPYLSDNVDGLDGIKNSVTESTFLQSGDTVMAGEDFAQLSFDHPLFIMFSSGTTGKPKCIVHSQGGTLLKHICELHIQSSLSSDDRLLFWTSSGWMMWNWMVSALALGTTVVLFDGSPFQPSETTLWDYIEQERVTAVGMGAQAWATYRTKRLSPRTTHNVSALHTVFSTGSPLPPDVFEWIMTDVHDDVLIASISGGTDIIGCFLGASHLEPVYKGECQCPMLGMAIVCADDTLTNVKDACGELVCAVPFPSQPTHFLNDVGGVRYRAAYFDRFGVDAQVWAHGDFCKLNSATGGVVMLGRSDATLNPAGVRFGSAEIYNALCLHLADLVLDSVCVGYRNPSATHEIVCLFVVLPEGTESTDDIVKRIKTVLRTTLSPRHVPGVVAQVVDIPYTTNGKKVEVAVRQTLHGEDVQNKAALRNPKSLDQFIDMPQIRKLMID